MNYFDLPVYRHCRLRTEKPKKPMFSLKMLWQPLSVCHPLPTPPTAAPPTYISRTHTSSHTITHTHRQRLDVNVRETLLYVSRLVLTQWTTQADVCVARRDSRVGDAAAGQVR